MLLLGRGDFCRLRFDHAAFRAIGSRALPVESTNASFNLPVDPVLIVPRLALHDALGRVEGFRSTIQ